MSRSEYGASIALSLLFAGSCARIPVGPSRDSTGARPDAGTWSYYAGDPGGMRFSYADQITPENVLRLRIAWQYQTGPSSPEATGHSASGRAPTLEATPILLHDRLYFSTPVGRVVALDARSGREIWTFDSHIDQSGDYGDFTSRGVSSWTDSRTNEGAPCHTRILLATIDARLIALDASNGRICGEFGKEGVVDLTAGIRNPPEYKGEYEETSAPAVIDSLIIVGSGIADNNRVDAPSGVIRAFDARSGRLVWSWDPVPQDSTDPAWESWIGPHAHSTGGANAWSTITVDTAAHLVFIPTGSASTDYFGGMRLGDNRYANSVIALHAATGKLAWSFQLVHHDLWDYDVAASPTVATITREDRRMRVVIQTGKTSQLYVLDEETGVPIFPVKELPAPRSSIPDEVAARTQPASSLPSLSPLSIRRDSIAQLPDADRESCRTLLAPLRDDGAFTPPSLEGSIVIPSNIGGPQWGGVTYDPLRNIVVVPVNRFAAVVQLIPRARYDSTTNEAGWEYAPMTGTPYVMRRRRIESAHGWPCTQPPWAALVAIDLATGRKKWEVPLGDPSELMEEDFPGKVTDAMHHWGTSVLGGAITTASGLVFVAGTSDHYLRAFSSATGAELWRQKLPGRGKATPMTYTLPGSTRQLVVIAVGADAMQKSGATLIAFSLP